MGSNELEELLKLLGDEEAGVDTAHTAVNLLIRSSQEDRIPEINGKVLDRIIAEKKAAIQADQEALKMLYRQRPQCKEPIKGAALENTLYETDVDILSAMVPVDYTEALARFDRCGLRCLGPADVVRLVESSNRIEISDALASLRGLPLWTPFVLACEVESDTIHETAKGITIEKKEGVYTASALTSKRQARIASVASVHDFLSEGLRYRIPMYISLSLGTNSSAVHPLVMEITYEKGYCLNIRRGAHGLALGVKDRNPTNP